MSSPPDGPVYLGMSGGVDSSAAAWILREEGRDVAGVTFLAYDHPEEVEAAARVCRFLGIPHHRLDGRQEFRRRVMEPFIEEYCRGRTPNPCVLCNRVFKFGLLAEWARQQGLADRGRPGRVATGHYVRLVRDEEGRRRLARGEDSAKDQSYFLAMVRPEVLDQILFPLADWEKPRVRRLVEEQGLPLAAAKDESQDICFTGGDYRRFLREEGIREEPGDFCIRGRKAGTHRGIPFYSHGQRRGLNVAAGRRVYVREIHPGEKRIVLGERPRFRRLTVGPLNLFTDWQGEGTVQIRYQSRPAEVDSVVFRDTPEGRFAEVIPAEPFSLAAPGQYAVFYQGDLVAAAGVIREADLLPES